LCVAFNLGWKIATVVNKTCDRSILKTYQSERRRIAQDLIDFDHKFSRLFSGRPAKDVMDEEGISMEEFKSAFERGNMFASGIAVDYGASLIVAKAGDLAQQGDGTNISALGEEKDRVVGKQHLSTNIKIGMRMPSFQILNQADARPSQFQELLKSNGRWRLVVFAGDLQDPRQWERITRFGATLADPSSFLSRYNKAGGTANSVIELLTLHSSPRTSIELLDLPDVFHPYSEREGWDYWKVFVDDQSYHEGHGHAYQKYGVDEKSGCVVVLRPDQYVSWIGEVEDLDEMERFFTGFMRVPSPTP
jgi:phenol 2-monooxygenase (NADPH)